MKNQQLTQQQRYQIESLLQVGTSKKRISELIETSESSVYREIKRNSNKRGYGASTLNNNAIYEKSVMVVIVNLHLQWNVISVKR